MSDILSADAPSVLRQYYQALSHGAETFSASVRPLLGDHLDFTGSLAGHHQDATDGFIRGATGFVSTVQAINVVREVHHGDASAVLYDATMPGGTVRFAEFFTFGDGVIDTLNLHYDGPDYLRKGGQ